MIIRLTAAVAAFALAAPAVFAQDAGDAEKGAKEFNKCKACHMIQAPDGTDIVKGGKTGPNLYGVIGREIASVEDFKYGDGILALKDKYPGGVWDTEAIEKYVTDPTAYLDEETGDPKLKSKMTFKMSKNQEHVAAFLLENSPDAPEQNPDGDPAPVMADGGDAGNGDSATDDAPADEEAPAEE